MIAIMPEIDTRALERGIVPAAGLGDRQDPARPEAPSSRRKKRAMSQGRMWPAARSSCDQSFFSTSTPQSPVRQPEHPGPGPSRVAVAADSRLSGKPARRVGCRQRRPRRFTSRKYLRAIVVAMSSSAWERARADQIDRFVHGLDRVVDRTDAGVLNVSSVRSREVIQASLVPCQAPSGGPRPSTSS